jgi:type II secretory pathway component PulF
MSEMVRGGAGRLSLEQLIALNDEIAALARAGLPLERGLRDVGSDLPGSLRGAMLRLSARMEQGAGLSEALKAEGSHFPPIYRAVVEAGLRAGRLSLAVEALASFIRNYSEARRAIALALWYPMIVLAVAYSLFVAILTLVLPRFMAAFDALRIPRSAPLNLLARLEEWVLYWGPIVPAVFVLAAVLWAWSGRASAFRNQGLALPIHWFPWMRSLITQFESANFAKLLAILLEQGVPLPEAITLASDASGDRVMVRAGRELAAAIERGEAGAEAPKRADPFPPLLRWLLTAGREQGRLTPALRELAESYRKRAMFQAEKMRVFLPTLLLLVIGMSASLLYGLSLFLPLTSLLRGLAHP